MPYIAPSVTISADGGIAGKTALITGGTRGIGHALVRRFADLGARVVTTGRSQPQDLPDGVHFVRADALTAEGISGVAAEATSALGHVDILINNVGNTTPHLGGVLDISDDEWLHDLTVNFLAAVRLNAALLPAMYERGRGTIIGISSAASFSPPPPVLHYACAKAALTTYTRGLAIEASPRGVRVNLVTPGNVVTPGGEELRQAFADSPDGGGAEAGDVPIPLGRLGEPADVVEAVVFLASERAPWITATELIVDGGQFQAR